MKWLSFRALLFWLGPTAGVGTLAGQTRSPVATGEVTVDTLVELRSLSLARVPAVRVFLPAGYASSEAKYPVLFANDGQDVEAIGLLQATDSLVASGAMRQIIVVAIDAGEDRLQNYGTAGQSNAQGLGAEAGAYERFLLNDLWPVVQRRYRVLPADVAIMGWSLGGLSAFDIAWRNSERFRTVGVFSGSFWWRTDDTSPETRQASRIVHRRVREAGQRRRLQVWLEAGRQDETADRDSNGVIDAIQDTRELIDALVASGLREGMDVQYHEVEGGHTLETWRKALPHFLRWAFGSGNH